MKKALSIILISFISYGAFAQKPFFGKTWLEPKVERVSSNKNSLTIPGGITNPDTVFFQLKPLIAGAYSFPDYKALALTGIAIEHIKYKFQTAKSNDEIYCDWSVNIVGGIGKTTVPTKTDTDLPSFGFGGTILNRAIGVYLLWSKYKTLPTDPNIIDTKNKKYDPVLALSYTF